MIPLFIAVDVCSRNGHRTIEASAQNVNGTLHAEDLCAVGGPRSARVRMTAYGRE